MALSKPTQLPGEQWTVGLVLCNIPIIRLYRNIGFQYRLIF